MPLIALLAQSPGAAFQVNRKEVMGLARIDSRVTYHRCIRELDKWGYIHYQPSYDPSSKSLVSIKLLAAKIPVAGMGYFAGEKKPVLTWI